MAQAPERLEPRAGSRVPGFQRFHGFWFRRLDRVWFPEFPRFRFS
jgi:hypothetical protein